MKLTVINATELTGFQLDAVRSAFKSSVANKMPRGGKKLYAAGLDFPYCCNVLIKRSSDRGNCFAEVR